MAADEIHVGDIGTVFEFTIYDGASIVDVSTATTLQLTFQKPTLDAVVKTAVFSTDGTDGLIKYTILTGDLDDAGAWKVQAKIIMSLGTWYSDVKTFQVYPNLS